MKNQKKFNCLWLPERNKPADSRFLPVIKHPAQAAIPDELTPSITAWDRVCVENGHDVDTRNKRQIYDSAIAERQQLYQIGPSLSWQTANYPPTPEQDGTFHTYTVGFKIQERAKA